MWKSGRVRPYYGLRLSSTTYLTVHIYKGTRQLGEAYGCTGEVVRSIYTAYYLQYNMYFYNLVHGFTGRAVSSTGVCPSERAFTP